MKSFIYRSDPAACFSITDWDVVRTVWCSDCWRSKQTNTTCKFFFWLYASLFLILCALVVAYCLVVKRQTKSFDWMFVFVMMQVATLVVYFSEAYVDYTWTPQIWFTSLTVAFTFLVIVITIENL
jgi:hypothetical protein